MLKIDTLKENPLLKELTEDQLNAIATMSERDEAAVIGARFRETYNQLDETILNATGITRNGDEKTYLYLERAVKAYTEKTKDYDELKKKVEEGVTDKKTLAELTQAKADLDAVKKQYNELKASFDSTKADYEKNIFGMKVDGVLDAAKAGLKFKSGANEQIVALAVKSAMDNLRSYSPSFTEDGKLVFHNPDGSTMNNAANALAPFTAQELLVKELSSFGILDDGKQRKGAGGKDIAPEPNNGAYASKTQALKSIQSELAAKGLVNGSADYMRAMDKAMADCGFAELPNE